MSHTTADKSDALISACSEAFGLHPEDILSPIETAASACSWLEEILKAISAEAEKEDQASCIRIKHLANAGAYLAFDRANYLGCQHGDMSSNLSKAGIKLDR